MPRSSPESITARIEALERFAVDVLESARTHGLIRSRSAKPNGAVKTRTSRAPKPAAEVPTPQRPPS